MRQDEGDFQMRWDMTVEDEDGGPGICKLVTGMGGAIAGAVIPATGGCVWYCEHILR